jgi:mannan endo-1,4-beta-mannosidase
MRACLRLAAAAVLAVAACSAPAPAVHGRPPAGRSAGRMVLGVYEPDDPGSYRQVQTFAAATGRWPSLVDWYSPWETRWPAAFAGQVHAHGAEPMVQIMPWRVSLAAIAAGRADAYLRSYAAAVRSYGHPVVISFGQEMNGSWYAWGYRHTSPQVFTAAWRHIVTVFRSAGAVNVTWLWDVNCLWPGAPPIAEWWPGSAYVTWAGMDCYYLRPADTFASRFGSVLTEIRKITSKPVLVAETAIGPLPDAAAGVGNLFGSVRADHLAGLVWFDEAQHAGIHHQDWRIESDPAALAAFRREVK